MNEMFYNKNYAENRGPGSEFMKKLEGATVTVAGMARAGIAAAKLLKQVGADVTVTDVKRESDLEQEISELKKANIHVETGGHSEETFTNCDLVVTSPGVPYNQKHVLRALDSGIPVMSEIELAYHYFPGRIIAVTGTNGKTTTAALMGKCLEEQGVPHMVCGNIGYPVSSAVMESPPDATMVLEVSSFQLERICFFRPDVGLILNITEDHMDRYTSMEDYSRFKRRIAENQLGSDNLVLNYDDPRVRGIAESAQAMTWFFSQTSEVEKGAFLVHGEIVYRGHNSEPAKKVMPVSRIPLPGRHNVLNTLAVVIVMKLIGVEEKHVRNAVSKFEGVKHRLEFVRELNGVRYFDDTPGTNVAAVKAALDSFDMPIILIAGGRSKGTDFSPLVPLIKEKVKALVLIGESRDEIKRHIGPAVPTLDAGSMEEAVKLASSIGNPGDVVLLSPMCASFDMFLDYKDRGEQFRKYVKKL